MNNPQRTVVITGASDGIGAAAAKQLSERGASVVVVGHSPAKTGRVAAEIGAPWLTVDYSDLSQVRDLAAALDEMCPRIDVLANNAGMTALHLRQTADGFERCFQINYLSHFLLTNLLLPKLIASRATVVQTSSIVARLPRRLDPDSLARHPRFGFAGAYSGAKLAINLFTRELHRRYHGQGLSSAAFHPGFVSSNIGAAHSPVMRFLYRTPIRRMVTVTPDHAAEQLVWLADGVPGNGWHSGDYLERFRPVTPTSLPDPDGAAARLWDRSLQMAGLA